MLYSILFAWKHHSFCVLDCIFFHIFFFIFLLIRRPSFFFNWNNSRSIDNIIDWISFCKHYSTAKIQMARNGRISWRFKAFFFRVWYFDRNAFWINTGYDVNQNEHRTSFYGSEMFILMKLWSFVCIPISLIILFDCGACNLQTIFWSTFKMRLEVLKNKKKIVFLAVSFWPAEN